MALLFSAVTVTVTAGEDEIELLVSGIKDWEGHKNGFTVLCGDGHRRRR